jgi:hypothetical protein
MTVMIGGAPRGGHATLPEAPTRRPVGLHAAGPFSSGSWGTDSAARSARPRQARCLRRPRT